MAKEYRIKVTIREEVIMDGYAFIEADSMDDALEKAVACDFAYFEEQDHCVLETRLVKVHEDGPIATHDIEELKQIIALMGRG